MPWKIGVSRFISTIACIVSSSLLVPTAVNTQEVAEQVDGWHFEITPYLSLAGMKGETGMNGYNANVDMSFGDILELLNIAGMSMFEVSKGPWLFSFDGQYFRLNDEKVQSAQGPGGWVTVTGELEATATEQLYQISAGYRLLDDRTKLHLIGAMRYTRLDVDLDLVTSTSGPIFPGGEYHLGGKEAWWDPVIGMRISAPLAEKWSFFGYADIGGFGVGSDLTYQPVAGVSWQFSKVVSAKLAYRYLSQKFETDEFLWDMKTHGPVLGVGFRF